MKELEAGEKPERRSLTHIQEVHDNTSKIGDAVVDVIYFLAEFRHFTAIGAKKMLLAITLCEVRLSGNRLPPYAYGCVRADITMANKIV